MMGGDQGSRRGSTGEDRTRLEALKRGGKVLLDEERTSGDEKRA